MKQTTQHIMMVRPASFGYNTQTAISNAFQHKVTDAELQEAQQKALAEFDGFVAELRKHGVKVNVIFDSEEPKKPDAIFPNNWITMHADGSIVLYPMYAPNRRWERRRSIIDLLKTHYQIIKEYDLSVYEEENKFLEGTGSMIFDRINKICYACLSVRTDKSLLEKFCQIYEYTPVVFTSVDASGKEIYHTNVMMSVAEKYAVICLESIRDSKEREHVVNTLKKTNKEIIDITLEQVNHLCGNVIELTNDKGESLLVMSEQSYKAFRPEQLAQIQKYSKIVYAPLYTIEKIGGGGARCMIAEIFLPEKN
ncbi:MAG: arginine deiminase-related protein [Cytophagales bacterium]|nr:arginine deiminase-related protein [Cytophagales bacterium]MDW8384118.1 arginine deiminase-related protein [Flammeovirgaceae bacterium]